MDYRNESAVTSDIRWNDRITYDGTWENNLFNFFMKVTPKLTEDLKKPFRLEGIQRIDETPVHKAVREAFVNLIIHADYLMDAGVLKVIKRQDEFEFTNPGILKLPLEEIYRGGNSKSRNPHMQTMLRLVGFGDNAGSGFPAILNVWKQEGWIEPEFSEDTDLNQITLKLRMIPVWLPNLQKLAKQIIANLNTVPEQVLKISQILANAMKGVPTSNIDGIEAALKAMANGMSKLSADQLDSIRAALKITSDTFVSDKELVFDSRKFAEALAEKPAESAEKSAESADYKWLDLSDRQRQILEFGGSIFVRQFRDRLVVESPGGLPFGITLDNILDRQLPRNRRIAEILSLCGMVERSGQGMNLMFELSVQEAKPLPDFTGTDDFFVSVTLNGLIIDKEMLSVINRISERCAELLSTEDFLVIDTLYHGRPLNKKM